MTHALGHKADLTQVTQRNHFPFGAIRRSCSLLFHVSPRSGAAGNVTHTKQVYLSSASCLRHSPLSLPLRTSRYA
jgi:hypothetical protein